MPVEKATFVFQRALKANFLFLLTTFSALFNNHPFVNVTLRFRNSTERREVIYFWSWVAATTFFFHAFIHTFNTHFVLLSRAKFFLFLKYKTSHQVRQRESFYNYHSLNECPERTDSAAFFFFLQRNKWHHLHAFHTANFFIKTNTHYVETKLMNNKMKSPMFWTKTSRKLTMKRQIINFWRGFLGEHDPSQNHHQSLCWPSPVKSRKSQGPRTIVLNLDFAASKHTWNLTFQNLLSSEESISKIWKQFFNVICWWCFKSQMGKKNLTIFHSYSLL